MYRPALTQDGYGLLYVGRTSNVAISGHVIQALRWIGRRYVDDRIIAQLRRNLNANHKAQLMKDLCHAPAWVADIMRRVAAPTKT